MKFTENLAWFLILAMNWVDQPATMGSDQQAGIKKFNKKN
jgi:hypothetical protein